MVELAKLAASEFDARLKEIQTKINEKEVELGSLEDRLEQFKKKEISKFSQTFLVEKKFNGFRAVISKKGDSVRIFSDQSKDISSAFPTAVEQAKNLANADFILDSEMVPHENGKPLGRDVAAKFIGSVQSGKKLDDSGIIFHVFDCIYYGRDVSSQPLFERKKILHSMKFSANLKEVPHVVVDNKADAEKAIKMFSVMRGSEGAMIKRYDGIYMPGKETDAWIKYRALLPFSVLVLAVNRVKGETEGRNYSVGIRVSREDATQIEPKFVFDYKGTPVELLSNTFNTSIIASEGDIIAIKVEEVWRHEYKDGKFRFSLHKPHVEAKLDKATTSSIADLDAAVVSRGVAVKESEQEMADEGKEIETKNFPLRMQQYFRKVKEAGKPMPFVVQWHYRGHEIIDEVGDIPLKYKYKMNSIHADFRMLVNNHLEGITLLSPTTSDPSVKDKLFAGKLKHVRALVKFPQPKQWLTIEGYIERGEPGTTAKSPAFFVIIARGNYLPVVIEDHRIIIKTISESGSIKMNKAEMEEKGIYISREPGSALRILPKYIEFHIAHIGNRWIILVDELSNYEENH